MPQNQGSKDRPDGELENRGPFRHELARTMHDFADGTAKTVMLSELLSSQVDNFSSPPADIRGNWAYAFVGASCTHHNTPNSRAPDEIRSAFCSNSDPAFREPHPCVVVGAHNGDPDVLQRCVARSNHPGGVQCLFVDGHVQFYVDDVNFPVWRALATINGAEGIEE
jgi:prepilin-type processing-associated H-X9-DG protein